MRTTARLQAWLLAAVILLTAGRAGAVLCFYDATLDGKGVVIKWQDFPIKIYVNPWRLSSAMQQDAIAAVQAAFASYELSCTGLKFQYEGVSSATTNTNLWGAILVMWGNDDTSWPYGKDVFRFDYGIDSYTKGELVKGFIGMNSRDYGWAVGAKSGKIDIQSMVTRIIPSVLGFYVGTSPLIGNQPIVYNQVDTALTPEHLEGATWLYFQPGVDCLQQPAAPPACVTWKPGEAGAGPTDAGVPVGWESGGPDLAIPGDGSVDLAAATGRDGGSVPGGDPSEDPSHDDGLGPEEVAETGGCCRIGSAPAAPASSALLLGALLLTGWLWRRRRR